MENIILDKYGKKYSVIESDCDSEDFKRFNIEYRGSRVGYANYHFEGTDVLYLDDWHIEDDAILPPWFSCDLFFCFLSFPPLRWRTVNFQKRGIGTAMIKFLADYARSKCAKRIEGEVKHHDFKDNPDLPDWYRRRGFSVVMGDEKTSWVAKISLAI